MSQDDDDPPANFSGHSKTIQTNHKVLNSLPRTKVKVSKPWLLVVAFVCVVGIDATSAASHHHHTAIIESANFVQQQEVARDTTADHGSRTLVRLKHSCALSGQLWDLGLVKHKESL